MNTYGSIGSFFRLYLFSFSSISENVLYSLLIQGTTPTPELLACLARHHSPYHFPIVLQPFTVLLSRYPCLAIFADVMATSLTNPTIFIPWDKTFTPLKLPTAYLPQWATSLFQPGNDSPMWCPQDLPPFSGIYPFVRHIQFWLFMHNCYQEAYTLPPCPFVFLHYLTPGHISYTPTFYFCTIDAIPKAEHLLTYVCPHVFVFDTHSDSNMEYYGVIVDRPSNLYADLGTAALEAKPIKYP